VGEWLSRWATEARERAFITEPSEQGRRVITYGDAYIAVHAIAQGLLDLGARPERPVMLLSDNSVDHALVQLAAMHLGVPAAPVSPAYSLASADHVKLREVADQIGPSVIYASDGTVFARAIDALLSATPDCRLVVSTAPRAKGSVLLSDLLTSAPGAAVQAAAQAVGPDTIAKVLFTSGSTGAPKGVVNTHRMLCSNQQAISQLWPFLDERPPVVVDWLPWSHTFGGNHNFNMVLRAGGTLHVDTGKPVPGRIEQTVAALRSIAPTMYFNVPRGFDALLPFLEADEELSATFFSDLDLLFYAAAALPQSTWDRLENLAARVRSGGVPFVSAWGSTETSPLITSVHFPIPRAGVIGLPAPGCEVLLVPEGDKLGMRVKGPNITPGAWIKGGAIRPLVVDEEGYLDTGDAGKLADPSDPSKGIVFDGRTAENFKLSSGTWVSVGELRIRLVSACAPLVQDAVIAGHDRDEVTALLFPTQQGATTEGRASILSALRAFNMAHPASSTRIKRALLLAELPSIDRGEITDKGYINQRAVLTHRSAEVARLYAEPPAADILCP
jgi:feruloyl-CoA synthase